MARYTGPKARLCRRFGENIFETPKYDKILERKNYAPGEHGQGFRKRESDYAVHLKEKQKLRFMYGLMERQFKGYFKKADKMKGITGENLMTMLEMRLDNIVFRLGIGVTRPQARQIVRHNHILVNNKRVNIPSYQCKPGDIVEVVEKAKNKSMFVENAELVGGTSRFEWLSFDGEKKSGEVLDIPTREQIPVKIDDRLIVEYYSK
ncbi:MAG: 30S ribosomal protein S4 [Candidatus Cloacimonadota bacterium]|nr:30S ribosomal protein S4 [Candidatus Cloacimonadota bacterium]